ncbi:ImmA/IrrE family metallo-endopeptidase [Timonella senegalensis]|uniref:ImmA/IrrE family metallo-endopeptidase n=1 Tax=Timonella senegalensis TaxID=1465825 RepID=UPI0035E42DED
MGCRVYFVPLPESHYGVVVDRRTIVVSSRLHSDFQREVLAHEIGHVRYGHDLRVRHDVPRDEYRADLYAARLLISPTEYALAEALCDGDLGAVARELRVSTKLLHTWQQWMKGNAA